MIDRKEDRTWSALLVGATALFCCASVLISTRHGAWYDEIWSLAMARHDLPFGEAVRARWLTDIHPPTFYLLAWLTEPVFSASIQRARLIGLVALVVAIAAAGWTTRQRPEARGFVLVLVLIVLGSRPVFQVAQEFRSSTLVIAAQLLAICCFYVAMLAPEDLRRRDRVLALCLIAALLVSFGTHYIASVIAALSSGFFILALWFSGKRRWAVFATAASIGSGLLLVTWYVVQRSVVAKTAGHFWGSTGLLAALITVARLCAYLAFSNVLVTAFAVRSVGRSASWHGPRALFIAACGATFIAAVASLLVLNAYIPFLQPRYLSALIPVCAAIPAALVANREWRGTWFFFTVTLTALSIVVNAFTLRSEPGWDRSAAAVAHVARICPDTAVHVRPYWRIDPHQVQQLASEEPIIRYGFAREAAAHGFKIEPDASARRSMHCPTVLWTAHTRAIAPDQLVSRFGMTVPADVLAAADNRSFRTQQVLILPPNASTAP